MGFALLGWCAYVLVSAHVYQTRQARAFDAVIASRPAPAGAPAAPADSLERVVPARNSLDPLHVAKIEIPRLGVSSMVREGVDDGTLSRAIGHVPGTPLFGTGGNVGLAGHRDSFFRPLAEIAKGDVIRVRTPTGGRYEYHVVGTEIVWPEDTRVLESDGTDMLTLVTCWPFSWVGHAPRRFIVKARLVDRA
jgi:sortase A